MKLFVFIALFLILGSLTVDAHRNHHKHHSNHVRRFLHGPHEFHEHHGFHGHHEPHRPHVRPHHYGSSDEEFRYPPWFNSFESGESNSDSDDEPENDNSFELNSFESSDEENWHSSRRHHCRGWRCPPQTTTRKPCQSTTTPRPTRTWATSPSETGGHRQTTKGSVRTTTPDITSWKYTPTFEPAIDPHTNEWYTTKMLPTVWFTPASSTNNVQTQDSKFTTEESPTTPLPSSRPTRNTWAPSEPIPLTTTTSKSVSYPEVTDSNAVTMCIDNCVTTPDYNPVCGTNGETYNNIGKLFCAKDCGIDVELSQSSACSLPPPYADDDDGSIHTSSTPATTTIDARTMRATSLTDFQECMKQCPITSAYSPICGTDYVTYINIDRLNCARKCGQEVQILCDRSCGECAVTKQSTTSPLVKQCLRLCATSSEYNPICGSNGVTYTNAMHLLCTQWCGEDVRVVQFAPCSIVTTQPTTTIEPYEEVTLSRSIVNCMRQCRVTSEHNPVCGTNNVTYANPGRLECAKYCGVKVELKQNRPCFLNGPQPSPMSSTQLNSVATVIEGNNDPVPTQSWNTVSPQFNATLTTQSWNTKSTISKLIQTLSSKATVPSSTRPWSTRITSPTTSPSALDFTMPSDVISSIFSDTTYSSSTRPTITTTEDDEIDPIDPRFGNESDPIDPRFGNESDPIDPRFGNESEDKVD